MHHEFPADKSVVISPPGFRINQIWCANAPLLARKAGYTSQSISKAWSWFSFRAYRWSHLLPAFLLIIFALRSMLLPDSPGLTFASFTSGIARTFQSRQSISYLRSYELFTLLGAVGLAVAASCFVELDNQDRWTRYLRSNSVMKGKVLFTGIYRDIFIRSKKYNMHGGSISFYLTLKQRASSLHISLLFYIPLTVVCHWNSCSPSISPYFHSFPHPLCST